MGRIEETLVAQTLGADMDAAVVVVAWAVAVGSSSAEVGDSGVVSSSNDSSSFVGCCCCAFVCLFLCSLSSEFFLMCYLSIK